MKTLKQVRSKSQVSDCLEDPAAYLNALVSAISVLPNPERFVCPSELMLGQESVDLLLKVCFTVDRAVEATTSDFDCVVRQETHHIQRLAWESLVKVAATFESVKRIVYLKDCGTFT